MQNLRIYGPADVGAEVSNSQTSAFHTTAVEEAISFAVRFNGNRLEVYHAETRLGSGSLSKLVYLGTRTNLLGANLARALVKRAISHCHQTHQDNLRTP